MSKLLLSWCTRTKARARLQMQYAGVATMRTGSSIRFSGVIERLGGELAKELRGSEVAVSVNTGHGPEGRHAVVTVYRLE